MWTQAWSKLQRQRCQADKNNEERVENGHRHSASCSRYIASSTRPYALTTRSVSLAFASILLIMTSRRASLPHTPTPPTYHPLRLTSRTSQPQLPVDGIRSTKFQFTEGPPRNLHLELLEPSRPPPSDFFERPCGSQPQLYRGQRTSQPQLFDSPRAVLSLEKRVHYLNDSSESRRYLPTQQTVTAFVADKVGSPHSSMSVCQSTSHSQPKGTVPTSPISIQVSKHFNKHQTLPFTSVVSTTTVVRKPSPERRVFRRSPKSDLAYRFQKHSDHSTESTPSRGKRFVNFIG